MSRLNKLIQDLCPNGVKFEPLAKLIQLNFGERITKLHNAGSLYPVYGGGGESFRTDEFNRQNEYVISRFAMSKECVRKVNGKFWLLDSGFTFNPLNDSISKDYIAYWLFNSQDHIFSCTSQGAQKNLNTKAFLAFRVPVPPFRIQEEIVRILDSFTSLEAELEAELEARQEQYRYYRNDIISKCTNSSKRMPLSDIGTLIRGHGMTKSDLTDKGIGAIHYGQLYTTFDTATDSVISYVSPTNAQSLLTVNQGNLIISNTSENLDDVGKAVAWLGDNQIVTGGHATVLRHNQNPKYLAYWFQTPDFQLQKRKFAAGTKVIELPAKALEKIIIPLPPLSEQSRIVSELDQFRLLNVSMSSGLPAEIEARHKQYEYYRDRLLTFKELGHE